MLVCIIFLTKLFASLFPVFEPNLAKQLLAVTVYLTDRYGRGTDLLIYLLEGVSLNKDQNI